MVSSCRHKTLSTEKKNLDLIRLSSAEKLGHSSGAESQRGQQRVYQFALKLNTSSGEIWWNN